MQKAYFDELHPRADRCAMHKTRLVAASVRLGELVLVQRPDPPQQVELVLQMSPHHLRPVGGDGELDAVLHERTERVPNRVLVR